MTLFLIACFFTLVPGAFLCMMTKKRIEYFLATSLMANSLLLYIFGWLGYLKAGLYFLYVLQAAAGIVGIGIIVRESIRKNKIFFKSLCRNFFTPGLLLFLIGSIFALYLSAWRNFFGTDEFSHWGRVVKIMFQYDCLPLRNPDVLNHILYKDYPYGVALIQYLFTKTYDSYVFEQSAVYFALSCLYIAVFSFFVVKLKWKNFGSALLIFFVSFFLCVNLYPKFFIVLQIDVLLGVTAAMLIAACVVERKLTCVNFILLFIIASFLIFIKQSGFGLFIIALPILVGSSIYYFCKLISKRNMCRVKSFLYTLIPYCAFIFYFLQKSLLRQLKMPHWKTQASFSNICDAWVFNVPEKFNGIYEKMFFRLFSEKVIKFLPVSFSYFLFVSLIALLLFIIAKNTKFGYWGRLVTIPYLFFSGFFIYSFSLLMLYVYRFTDYEGTRLASFERYMGTYICIGIFVLIFYCGLYIANKKSQSKYFVLLLLVPFLNNIGSNINFIKREYINERGNGWINANRRYIEQHLQPGKRFFGVWQDQVTFGYQLVMSLYYPENFTVGSSWGDPVFAGDIWTRNIPKQRFAKLVRDNDFCFVSKVNNSFVEKYGEFFVCRPLKEHCMYVSRDGKLYPLPNKKLSVDFKSNLLFIPGKKVRAAAELSGLKGALSVKLMNKGLMTLLPKKDLDVSNGYLKTIDITVENITGSCKYEIIVQNVAIAEGTLSSEKKMKITADVNLPDVKNLQLKFRSGNQSASFDIKEIHFNYSDVAATAECKDENNVVLNFENPTFVPGCFSWDGAIVRKTSDNRGIWVESQGRDIFLSNKEKILIPDNGNISLSAEITIHDVPFSSVYCGFVVYDRKMRRIMPWHAEIKKATDTVLLSPVSAGSKIIYVKNGKNWRKNYSVAWYTKEDLSDLPNFSADELGRPFVADVQKITDEKWKIILTNPIKKDVAAGTNVRLHGGVNYLYVSISRLFSGKAKVLSGKVRHNALRLPRFDKQSGWPIGAEYASLIFISQAKNKHRFEVRDLKVSLEQELSAQDNNRQPSSK